MTDPSGPCLVLVTEHGQIVLSDNVAGNFPTLTTKELNEWATRMTLWASHLTHVVTSREIAIADAMDAAIGVDIYEGEEE